MKWFVALLLVLGGLYYLVDEDPLTEEEVVGVYTGEHQGYSDQVDLTADGRFTQILTRPDGEIMTSSGTWKLKNKGLILDGYLFFIDEQVEGSAEKPYRTSLIFSVHQGMLTRDWGNGFYKLTQRSSQAGD